MAFKQKPEQWLSDVYCLKNPTDQCGSVFQSVANLHNYLKVVTEPRQVYCEQFLDSQGRMLRRLSGALLCSLISVSIHLQCMRPGFDPWVGKILWRRERLPTPIFLPGEFHGQRSLEGYSPQCCKESDTTEQLTLSLLQSYSNQNSGLLASGYASIHGYMEQN